MGELGGKGWDLNSPPGILSLFVPKSFYLILLGFAKARSGRVEEWRGSHSILKCRRWPEAGQVSIGEEAPCALLD
jgi:hypothetical protein